jgi:ribosomal-protein-alanine N-acetyltransferase
MLNILKDQLPITISDELVVRMIDFSDRQGLFEMYSNEKVSKYVSRKVHTSLEDAEELVELINQRIKDGSNLYVGVCETCSQKLIGIIRFISKEDDLGAITIGYALNEDYWGRGIMPLVLNKLIQLISLDKSHIKLRATVRPENVKSQRCLEKLGFELDGRFMKKEIVNGEEVETERLEYFKNLQMGE